MHIYKHSRLSYFKLRTCFLLIVQLITALANDSKLTHPYRTKPGRKYPMHLLSFRIITPSVAQCPTKKLEFV